MFRSYRPVSPAEIHPSALPYAESADPTGRPVRRHPILDLPEAPRPRSILRCDRSAPAIAPGHPHPMPARRRHLPVVTVSYVDQMAGELAYSRGLKGVHSITWMAYMHATPRNVFAGVQRLVDAGIRLAIALTALLLAAGSAFAAAGALTQLPGTDACVSHDGSGGDCVDGKALQIPSSLAITRDGRYVYVAATGSDAVSAFHRNPITGALTQLDGTGGCISNNGTGGI